MGLEQLKQKRHSLKRKKSQERHGRPRSKRSRQSDVSNDQNLLEVYKGFEDGSQKSRSLLPIKTSEGLIQRSAPVLEKETEEVEGSDSGVDVADKDASTRVEEQIKKTTVDLVLEREVEINEKKIKIGCYAANLIAQPHRRMKNLEILVKMFKEARMGSVTLRKLLALSLVEVFMNIIPAYKINIHKTKVKVSKETGELHQFEKILLTCYQKYLNELEVMASSYRSKTRCPVHKGLSLVAVKCFTLLFGQHIKFNMGNILVKNVLPFTNSAIGDFQQLATEAVSSLLKSDKKGHFSLLVVQNIDRMCRRKTFNVRPNVLKLLLNLNIHDCVSLDEVQATDLQNNRKLTRQDRILRKLVEKARKKPSKRQAKERKKQKKVESEKMETLMKKAETNQNKHHSEILRLVFGLYIRILKKEPNSKLIGVVLEGLARFSHLINIEFFSDLMNVLFALMEGGTLTEQEQLHCIQTVITVLSGKGEVLNIDPRRFYNHLYSIMLNIHAGGTHEYISPLYAACYQGLVVGKKRVTALLVIAFAKRLATVCLNLSQNSLICLMILLRHLIVAHPKTDILFDPSEDGSSGVYQPEAVDPEHSNPGASALWDMTLLVRHYHPTVRELAKHQLSGKNLHGSNSVMPVLMKKSVSEIYEEFRFDNLTDWNKLSSSGQKKQGRSQCVNSVLKEAEEIIKVDTVCDEFWPL